MSRTEEVNLPKPLKQVIYIIVVIFSLLLSLFLSLEVGKAMINLEYDKNSTLFIVITSLFAFYLLLLLFFRFIGIKLKIIKKVTNPQAGELIAISKGDFSIITNSIVDETHLDMYDKNPKFIKTNKIFNILILFLNLLPILLFSIFYVVYPSIVLFISIENVLALSILIFLLLVLFINFLLLALRFKVLNYTKLEKNYSKSLATTISMHTIISLSFISILMEIVGYVDTGVILSLGLVGIWMLYSIYYGLRLRNSYITLENKNLAMLIGVLPARFPILTNMKSDDFNKIVISTGLINQINNISEDNSGHKILEFIVNVLFFSSMKRNLFFVVKLLCTFILAVCASTLIDLRTNEGIFLIIAFSLILLYLGYFILGSLFLNQISKDFRKNCNLYFKNLRDLEKVTDNEINDLLDDIVSFFSYLTDYQQNKDVSIFSNNMISAFYSVVTYTDLNDALQGVIKQEKR